MRDSRFSLGRGVMIGRVAAISMILMLTIIPVLARVSTDSVVATKPPPSPPPSTGTAWARAYSIPYSYSGAESVAQASSGGYFLGALLSAASGTPPHRTTPPPPTSKAIRVGSHG